MTRDKTKSKSSECNLRVRITSHKEKIIDDSYTFGDLHSDLEAWVPWDSSKDPVLFQKLNIRNRKQKLMSRRHEKNIELHVILQDSDLTHSKDVPLGLINEGTNCYLNAGLQVIKATTSFSTYLSGDEYGEKCATGCISCSLRTYIHKASKSSVPIYPSMVLNNLSTFGSDFASVASAPQKDSKDFLMQVFTKFADSDDHPKNKTIKAELFGGRSQIESGCKCREKEVSFVMLEITVQHRNHPRFTSLKEMMDWHTSKQASTSQCIRCTLPRVSDQLRISHAPKILVIALDRMIPSTGSWWRDRDDIDCPMELDISPYMSDSAESTEHKYELYGALVHVGGPDEDSWYNPNKNDDYGHWYCYTRCNKVWYKIDDIKVTTLTKEQVETKIRKSSVLFYTRKTREDCEARAFEQEITSEDSDMSLENSSSEDGMVSKASLTDQTKKIAPGRTTDDVFLPEALQKNFVIAEDISRSEVRKRISAFLEGCTPEKHRFLVPRKTEAVYNKQIGAFCEPKSKYEERVVCSTKTSTKKRALNIYTLLNNILGHLDDGAVSKTGLSYQQGKKGFDATLNTVCRMLRATRASLDIVIGAKGKIMGHVKMYIGRTLHMDCTDGKSHLIPHDSHLVDEIVVHKDLRFILIIEKEPILTKLEAKKFAETYNCIVLCGKGQADVATKSIAHKLAARCKVPIYGFADHNASGALIMLNYKFGSRSRSFDNLKLTVPRLEWIGMHGDQCYGLSSVPRPQPRNAHAPQGSKKATNADNKKLSNYLEKYMPLLAESFQCANKVAAMLISNFTMDVEKAYPHAEDIVNLFTQLIPEIRLGKDGEENRCQSEGKQDPTAPRFEEDGEEDGCESAATQSPSEEHPISRVNPDFAKRGTQASERSSDMFSLKRRSKLRPLRFHPLVVPPKKSPPKRKGSPGANGCRGSKKGRN